MTSSDAQERARGITTVVFDVDGVLTDGSILLDSAGNETKRFNVHDGTAVKYLMRAGLRVALISGRKSMATSIRATELGVEDVYQGYKDKIDAYVELKKLHSLEDAEIAYMGDDLPDIPVMREAGLAVAVANARPEVREAAHMVTDAPGGKGAARELADWLLKTLGKWEGIMKRYVPPEA